MAKYVVSYDVSEGGDYDDLYELLKTLKAVPALKSTWLVQYKGDADALVEDLKAVVPNGTKLLVTPHASNDWNAVGLSAKAGAWLNGE